MAQLTKHKRFQRSFKLYEGDVLLPKLFGQTVPRRIPKVLRYGPCVTRGSHSFACLPHTNHTCLYSPTTRRHHPLAGTHCAYRQMDGQAELIWVVGLIPRWMSYTGNWTQRWSPIPVLTQLCFCVRSHIRVRSSDTQHISAVVAAGTLPHQQTAADDPVTWPTCISSQRGRWPLRLSVCWMDHTYHYGHHQLWYVCNFSRLVTNFHLLFHCSWSIDIGFRQ